MKTLIYKAGERGTADYGWLKPNYYFSFSQYYHPSRVHFGMLRVLNDDYIAGGGGFPTHPHDNMEIVTIPLSGALAHRDSAGGEGIIKAGDVQIMSAGSGVQHSEFNASETEPVTLFQIWVFPKIKNITPRYNQRSFNVEDSINKWQTVVSPLSEDDALWINQDACFSLTFLQANHSISYHNKFKDSGVFLVVINGNITLGGDKLNSRDAVGITATDEFTVEAEIDAQLLAIEVPMQ